MGKAHRSPNSRNQVHVRTNQPELPRFVRGGHRWSFLFIFLGLVGGPNLSWRESYIFLEQQLLSKVPGGLDLALHPTADLGLSRDTEHFADEPCHLTV